MDMRAIGYVRFSSERQDKGSSRERQRELIEAFCSRHNLTVDEWCEDLGSSAWKGDHLSRGNLGKLTKRIERGEVQAGTVIVVERVDRLSRQGYDILNAWMAKIVGDGIRVATVEDDKIFDETNFSKGLETKLTRLLKAEAAKEYVDAMAERVRKGIEKRQREIAETGVTKSNVYPKWLKKNSDGSFSVIEERAEVIRRVYELYADGFGVSAIAKLFNEEGVENWTTNGWMTTSIRHMLVNHCVEGLYQPLRFTSDGKKEIAGDKIKVYPSIVDEALVIAVRSRLAEKKDRGGQPSNHGYVNIFKGLTKCVVCGGKVHLYRSGDRRYYRCHSGGYKRCDNSFMYRAEELENFVLDQLLHLALDDAKFSNDAEVKAINLKLAKAQDARDKARERARRLAKHIADEDDPDPDIIADRRAYIAEAKNYEAQIDQLQNDLAKAQGKVEPTVHIMRVQDVRNQMASADEVISKVARQKVAMAMQGLIEEIWFGRGGAGNRAVAIRLTADTRVITFDADANAIDLDIDMLASRGSDEAMKIMSERDRSRVITYRDRHARAKEITLRPR